MNFQQTIILLYGEQGEQWLEELPLHVSRYAQYWGLTELQPVENLSFNYVMTGMQGDRPIVLKMSYPRPEGLKNEPQALRAFDGHGMVKLIDETEGALLCNRLIPGKLLSQLFPHDDDRATQIFITVMRRIHTGQTGIDYSRFIGIEQLLCALDQSYDIPNRYLVKARAVRDYLCSTSQNLILLHGDLHHDNILSHGSDWVAIDPKGIVGEPLCEVAPFIHNPHVRFLEQKDYEAIIKRRLSLLVQASVGSKDRLIAWCFVQNLVRWIWMIEDGLLCAPFPEIVAALYRLLESQ